MKPEELLKNQLRKRQQELQQIIRQMKSDDLHASKVYQKLEEELESVNEKMTPPPDQATK